MPGPIASLTYFGLICPCFEKEEDRNARSSVNELNQLGACVDWHPVAQNNTSASGFVRGLFSRSQSSSSSMGASPMMAQMKLVDATRDNINNGDPFPELQIKPLGSSSVMESPDLETDDPELGGSAMRSGGGAPAIQLDIPLHHILRVEDSAADPTMVILHTKDIHAVDDKKFQKEAARIAFDSQDKRDKVSLDLKLLIEWHKHKQPHIEEELPRDGLKARAKKAAHFARRELEMRETKRTRESRKAKYIQDSGGLKYTAIAMANRTVGS
uniref:Uncharacterized protein n=1 Tax=Craspedostauros australis TaxID=1486917 RepID=A0A7R9ZLQ0_9STRA|mmetsp:Transcript_17833/g.49433  ORF Transcript_17833/g.49433 Transcript_17833/m.49433 type:complete len:270 (+) Transcript_17833:255-1064(+)|eukprot:CAMPEP_0198125072 /NCGR_PEP_ID=MMETSP1442-20131203/41681_1 /TAXON_ID= /ORGANISM="Craspedostauros australis, Strain CCMP3328" /LENGTH=269 /DNA_ID=CAMNT_0043784605 /DNA_START=159 /DNA_END=968 /DNA_ORIENTATION=-